MESKCEVLERHQVARATKQVANHFLSSDSWPGDRDLGATEVWGADESVENEKRQNQAWTTRRNSI